MQKRASKIPPNLCQRPDAIVLAALKEAAELQEDKTWRETM